MNHNQHTNEFFILIVDDNQNNIKTVGSVLREKGYQIGIATSGEKALQIIENKKYNLILLDVMMPGMDGYEVCAKLKANPNTQEIPVIFLTARHDEESINRGFEVGGVDYVTKPFNSSELLARVQIHLQIYTQQKQLQGLITARDKILSIISHDLRTPFNNMLGLVDLLSRSYNSTKKMDNELLEHMQKTLHSGRSLLENLLHWSRSQTGRLKASTEAIHLKPFINNLVEEYLSEQALQKEIQMDVRVPEELNVLGDQHMLSVIFTNLMSNALKFTQHHGKVTLHAEGTEKNICIRITDTGIGMKPEVTKHLFDVENNSTTRGTDNEKGSGLGLLLCNEFIKKNEGTLEVESEFNKGSTFSVTLPKARVEKSIEF